VGFSHLQIGVLLAEFSLSIESSLILWQEEVDKITVSAKSVTCIVLAWEK